MSSNIFVAGTARSGSTWTVNVLGQAPGIKRIREPDYLDVDESRGPGSRGFGPYPVIDPGERSVTYEALWDVAFAGAWPPRPILSRAGKILFNIPKGVRDPMLPLVARVMSRHPTRTAVKSILSAFSLEWIHQRYAPQVLIIQRDPLNVVASWIELEIPLFGLWRREDIRRRYTAPLGLPPPPAATTHHQLAAWCVGLITTALAGALDRHQDWLLVTHEELCVDPVSSFRRLYQDLDLRWSESVERYVRESNRPGTGKVTNRVAADQPLRWRERLSRQQAGEILNVLETFPSRGWVRELSARSEQPAI